MSRRSRARRNKRDPWPDHDNEPPNEAVFKWSMSMKLKLFTAACLTIALGGCMSDADVASQNLSRAADNFDVSRRIVFYNGITGDYVLSIEGLCSKGNQDNRSMLTITCKTAPGVYKKHFLGLSDNVTYFIEQVDAYPAGTNHYVVNFKPSAIIPDIRVR